MVSVDLIIFNYTELGDVHGIICIPLVAKHFVRVFKPSLPHVGDAVQYI